MADPVSCGSCYTSVQLSPLRSNWGFPEPGVTRDEPEDVDSSEFRNAGEGMENRMYVHILACKAVVKDGLIVKKVCRTDV